MDSLLFLLGLGLLLWGAGRLVDNASGLARAMGISPLAIAVLVVGLGTSMPELLTSLDAALQGSAALAIGNVVGSNIANLLLVLGLIALCVPLSCDPAPMRRDLLSLILASTLTLLFLQQDVIERWMGLLLAAGLVAYLAVLLATSRERGSPSTSKHAGAKAAGGIARSALLAMLSLAVLLAGAHLTVSGALGIANRYGLSESVVGLGLVALGTSLPELAVSVLAIVRRSAEVAIGNIVGSSLFNLLGILGITALVTPLEVPAAIARVDIWIMLAAVLALTVFARTGWRVSRAEGGTLLLGYPTYLVVLLP